MSLVTTFPTIADAEIAVGAPCTPTLLKKFRDRDEVLRESMLGFKPRGPTGINIVSPGVQIHKNRMDVPRYAVVIKWYANTKVSAGFGEVWLKINATEGPHLVVTWTTARDDLLSITPVDGDKGVLKDIEFWGFINSAANTLTGKVLTEGWLVQVV